MSIDVDAHLLIGVGYDELVNHVGEDVAQELKEVDGICSHGNCYTGETWFIGREVDIRDLTKPTWPAIYIETCKQVAAQFDMPIEKVEISNGTMTS